MAADFSAFDFQQSFSIEEASVLIQGMQPRFHPNGIPQVVRRMRDAVAKGEMAIADGVIPREEISRWLAASGLMSEYQFGIPANLGSQSGVGDIDPSDLPPELDAANMAYRAIENGYGDSASTPKQRLVAYLESHYPSFKPEQVKRIATVANPDKSTGRKKPGKE